MLPASPPIGSGACQRWEAIFFVSGFFCSSKHFSNYCTHFLSKATKWIGRNGAQTSWKYSKIEKLWELPRATDHLTHLFCYLFQFLEIVCKVRFDDCYHLLGYILLDLAHRLLAVILAYRREAEILWDGSLSRYRLVSMRPVFWIRQIFIPVLRH